MCASAVQLLTGCRVSLSCGLLCLLNAEGDVLMLLSFLQVWAIPCIRNSGPSPSRRRRAAAVDWEALAVLRRLILRLYVCVTINNVGLDNDTVLNIGFLPCQLGVPGGQIVSGFTN